MKTCWKFPRRAVVFLAALCWFASPCAEERADAGSAPSFDIIEFAVEGNSVLDAEAIERAVYPFMGERRTFDDVQAATAALEKAYRAAGFGTVTVDIPEQRVDAGVIRLKVMQGEVARLRVTGSRYFSQERIIGKIPTLAEGQVPNLRAAQEQIASVNRTADRRVTPLLRPGKVAGTTEVDLQVEDRLPLHGSVELNNRSSPNTSSARLQASLRFDNLWQRDHSVGLQLQVSPQKPREVKVLSASYSLPIGVDQLSFSVLRSDSEVVAGVGDVTVFGRGTIWGVRRSFTILLGEREYHAWTLGADYKQFDELTSTGGKANGFTTPVRYLPLSLSYTGMLEDNRGRWQFGSSLLVALREVLSSDAQFRDKRYLGSSGFSAIHFDLSRDQKLPQDFSVAARVDGQWAGQPLISNEQFVAGGVDSVRGYDESVASGDIGLRLGLELRSPEWAGKQQSWIGSLRMHAFVEAAALQTLKPLPGQDYRIRLLGAGLGLRAKGKSWGSLNVDLGWPLLEVSNTKRGDLHVHAAGTFEF